MKKLAVLFFFGALVVGFVGAQVFSCGKMTSVREFRLSGPWSRLEGSGNIVREARSVRTFGSIEVGSAFHVEVNVGPALSVEVEGDDNLLEFVKTDVRGDTLHIDMDKSHRSKERLRVHISVPNLNHVDSSGAASVNVVGLQNEKFGIDSSGGSKVTVAGRTGSIAVDISGGARVNASDLIATNGNVETSGGATAEVSVSSQLKARASGGSRILYAGSPTHVDSNASGGAKISVK